MRINRRGVTNKEKEAGVKCGRTDLRHSEPREGGVWGTNKAANLRSQKPSRTISVTQCDTGEVQSGGERNKTDRLNGKDEGLSAHHTSIWATAAANVKWIQHFPSHYPITLRWPAPIGSNQLANQPALHPPPSADAIFSLQPFGEVQ